MKFFKFLCQFMLVLAALGALLLLLTRYTDLLLRPYYSYKKARANVAGDAFCADEE